ncbi:leucine-rich repeat domain-containing protein, partial [Thermodesulfovibrionales bacterium]|nr:leucine-rich repeat domain-containing protein [Thermodesulfovibrionales bacterium]
TAPVLDLPQLYVTPTTITRSLQQGTGWTNIGTVNVTNPGGGTLSWTVTDDRDWIRVSPSSGNITTETDSVTVEAKAIGLAVGDHPGIVTFTGAHPATGSPDIVSITLTVTTDVVPPTVETRPATSITKTRATLKARITSDGGAAITGRGFAYRIVGHGHWRSVGGTDIGGGYFSYCATGLIPGTTYEFKAQAANAAGSSGWTTPRTFTTATAAVPEPVLHVSPTAITHSLVQGTGWTNIGTIDVTNPGEGVLRWSATVDRDDRDWIRLTVVGGTTTTETDFAGPVRVTTAGLAVGTHRGTVTLTGAGMTKTVDIILTVYAAVGNPMLHVSPTTIHASLPQGMGWAPVEIINVTNLGGGTLTWSLCWEDEGFWMDVSPSSGTTTTETDFLTVQILTRGSAVGDHHGTITLTGAGMTRIVPVTLTVTPAEPVIFADPNLEAAIRERLGMEPHVPIYPSHLVQHFRGWHAFLSAHNRNISDLTGLQYARGLERLFLRWNQIADLSPLSRLLKLEELLLDGNQVTDLSPLSGLVNLQRLGLIDNQITDISPLLGLVNLQRLDLRGNPLSAASHEIYLPELKARGVEVLYDPLVKDEVVTFPDPNLEAAIREALRIGPDIDIYRSDLERLTELSASHRGISDLTGLEYAVNLTSLDLEENQIIDITPLTGLTNLTGLSLWHNQITDISALSGLTNLTELGLGDNKISYLAPLSGLTKLTVLGLGENQISDLSPLMNNEGLGAGDKLNLLDNPLSEKSLNTYIPELEARGVVVLYDVPGVVPEPDPELPRIIGSVITPGQAEGVFISGNHAFVADLGGLQIIDISNPTSPVIIGSVDTPGSACDVFIFGNHAYVADWERGLQIIDISNPSSPFIVGSVDTPGRANDVFISGDHAFVADGRRGLQIIDISNPSSPFIVGRAGIAPLVSIDTPGSAEGVFISGNHAFVADKLEGLQIIDITNPASPFIAGSVDTPGRALGVFISGNHAFVADKLEGLQIIDITNPASPFIAGSVTLDFAAVNVFISRNYAFVVNGPILAATKDRGLQIIDIFNPSSPFIVGSVGIPGSAQDIFISGNHAYIANISGLQIIDISAIVGVPADPEPEPISAVIINYFTSPQEVI